MPKTLTVLIVDDDDSLAELASAFVRADGHEVIVSHNARHALEMVSKHRPHAVLVDVGLPDMSGMEVCRRIKADDATKHIPVIVLSAASTKVMESHAEAIGAFAFFAKPYDPGALIASLREAMGLPAAPSP